ncbi:DEAD/DEAH-box helicase family protein (macronuclear) [Tetrahymena thermophila SB210]|uniref:ATP-dependent RNA helicase n=1 Tax=Tetrahymena thermophila (strain SB210) TaxID=312017 RepID=I7M8Z5_TETTS|nr:DEAD/DEAH-box helicase family protein [Tetrahymena thermophila SB210]EAS00345.3 DEAD/DEAH-box helicase family protein [Tetrahymena thermophila SB210]|eukprot:XP_001020590.3 DEAD/DEAH-box helicase family protein [Tetrahymena thermophila SB210]
MKDFNQKHKKFNKKNGNQSQQQMKKKGLKKHQKHRYHDVEKLQDRIRKETPASGEYLYDYKLEKAEEDRAKLQPEEFRKKYKINFSDLPISYNTIFGLEKRKFIKMTEIQRCTIPHILAGRDVLAASKTGSGKTLSYLVPLVERLYVQKWNPLDGLGAIIILPTRELATQVFEVFNSFTQNHDLSVGLIIGGKNVKYEKEHMKGMNVLICTPGRLLQHMDETPDFDCTNLQMLVIDEADLILDLGFKEHLNAILLNLPKSRQTILFSATLSKSIHELSKLSLKNAEHIFLHEVRSTQDQDSQNVINTSIKDIYEAPIKLTQYYMEINIEDKLNMLFSFLRSHKKNKVLVFLSTCKQVRFVYEAFRRLKLGPPVFELHGRQKQAKRLAIFFTFAEKKFGVLFTTNLAARGLDFPGVEWIVQVDCPDDVVTYVHRVGRTARFKNDGNSLLMVLPSEIKMIDKLKEKKMNIQKLKANPEHQLSITNSLQSYLVESVDLKYLAQRAFISYVRSIHFAADKEVFNVNSLDLNGLSESLGLIQTPVINIKGLKNEESDDDSDGEESNSSDGEKEDEVIVKKQDRLAKLKEKIKKMKEEKARKKLGLPPVENNEQDDDDNNKEEQEIKQKKEKKQKQNKQNEEMEIEENTTKASDKKDKKKKKASIEISEEKQAQVDDSNQADENNNGKKAFSVKHEKLVKRKNQDVLSENYQKLRNEKQNNDEDDFLVPKKKGQHEDLDESNYKINTLKVSKNKLKKIHEDGYFGGKNITYFTDDGKQLTKDDLKMMEYKQNEKKALEEEEDLVRKHALKLELNRQIDKDRENARRKEKKEKRKMLKYEQNEQLIQRNQAILAGDSQDEEEYDDDFEGEQIEEEEIQSDYSQQKQDNIDSESESEEQVIQKQKKIKKQKKHK